MVRQAQVVVAAEAPACARACAVVPDHALVRRARRLGDAPAASQRLRVALTQLAVQVFDQHREVAACGHGIERRDDALREPVRQARRPARRAASGTPCGRSGGSAARARDRRDGSVRRSARRRLLRARRRPRSSRDGGSARRADRRAAAPAPRVSAAARSRLWRSTSSCSKRSSTASAARHASALPVYECECRKPRATSSSRKAS